MNETKQSLAVPVAIVIAGIFIAGALYLSGTKNTETAKKPTTDAQAGDVTMKPIDIKKDHILGNPDAPIKIVEYSDTECPYCKRFHTTLNKIVQDYGKDGKVAWVYRHFPLDIHPKARKEAEATECAAELGGNTKFWAYINKVYEVTPGNNGLDPAELPKIAVEVGLDKTAFESCLASGRHAATVEASFQDGLKAGARGTPYSVIVTKDQKIPITQGALPYEDMKSVIDMVIKNI